MRTIKSAATSTLPPETSAPLLSADPSLSEWLSREQYASPGQSLILVDSDPVACSVRIGWLEGLQSANTVYGGIGSLHLANVPWHRIGADTSAFETWHATSTCRHALLPERGLLTVLTTSTKAPLYAIVGLK